MQGVQGIKLLDTTMLLNTCTEACTASAASVQPGRGGGKLTGNLSFPMYIPPA